ncbi:hypothetical protein MOQ72_41395 [Saccharopolyspora sp. K220]|uniref:hypothetical protein n=1 Tax=Saccharopolyspora soli TaxID=2926618 RepID=UPI001F5B009F|nr:hypothetical protein [Saccharopolyspora soli]MCI2423876.1 hypothetical protein [Saccharopolyspora soli]
MADLDARIRARLDATPANRPESDLADALRVVLDKCDRLGGLDTAHGPAAAAAIRAAVARELGVDADV